MGTKTKPIFAKPKAKADITTYLIDVLWSGRLWNNRTNLMSDVTNRMRKTEIDI
jgi:hypothetical protein